MSATNRGSERNEKDYYMTPLYTVRTFLEKFSNVEPGLDFANCKFLDPCAGGDNSNPMAYPFVLKEMGARSIDSIDIRDDSLADKIGDYLSMDADPVYDAIFTNPPYGLGMEFIEKALCSTRDGGFVGMLMRLNYLGSAKRKSFWQSNMPKWIMVHSKRPSFCKGATDATEYAHIVWQKGYAPLSSNLMVI